MDNTIWNEVNSTLDLNGPILSFTEQPTGSTGIGTTVGATGGGSLSFTGISTGVDPGTGYLSYQWYEENVGILEDSTYVTGTASTGPVGTAATLTISNLISPTDNQRKFYVVADYVSSAYGAGKSTGNAWNEPLTSGIATVTVTPLIDVIAQPAEGVQALINEDASITVNADLTDSYFADDLTYQWYLNGEIAEDGVKTVSTTTGTTESALIDQTYTSSESSHSFPSVQIDNLEITISGASGGNGGYDGGGPGGIGGATRVGRFSMVPEEYLGSTVSMYIGHRGNGGASGGPNAYGRGGNLANSTTGDGGRGGGAGSRGWSGGGGGGGAASYIEDNVGKFIVAGGGGGGGGGSHRRGGSPAGHASSFVGSDEPTIRDTTRNGNAGGDRGGGDGGGGGGGGGGSPGGNGGHAGLDTRYGGGAGAPGGSRYDRSRVEGLHSEWNQYGNGYFNIKYRGYTSTEVTTVTNTTLSGTKTNTLTIKSDSVGVQTCQCKITSSTASNSPIWTDTANFVSTTTVDEYIVQVEGVGIGVTASLSQIDLANGDYEFVTSQSQVSTGGITKYYSFYSPDKDIDVEMDLYGGKGQDFETWVPANLGWGSGEPGGEGGYSRIRFTMKKDEEYVIAGLSTESVNTPFVYRQGELIACVGEGGRGGKVGRGGFGGGVGVAGEDGRARLSGIGGALIQSGDLTNSGIFGSEYYPAPLVYPGDAQAESTMQGSGRTIRCTKGVYWAQQGVGACDDMPGTNVFRLPDGTPVTNTALITRGFKAGYNIMETAATGSGDGGQGGNGATGGQGGASGGGGGGSGYNDGSVTVVDTRLGGSTDNAKVVLRIVT